MSQRILEVAGYKLGDIVSVKGQRGQAEIKSFLSDIEGGVLLSDYVGGFRYWNVTDLVRIK